MPMPHGRHRRVPHFLLLLASFAVALAATGCRTSSTAEPAPAPASAPPTDVAAAPSAPEAQGAAPSGELDDAGPRVIFETATGDVPVTVELAVTPEEQARGLMFRRELADGHGMLFVFPGESVHTFWMKNTLIPLDMIHISSDGRVVGVVARAEPQTLTARRVGVPARYVLEVPGGWAERRGVSAGVRVRFASLEL